MDMFSPRELDGEVDHSFFDSDCDDCSIRKDKGKKMETRLVAENGSLPVPDHGRQSQSQTAAVGGDWAQTRPEGATTPLNEGERNHIREAEKAKGIYGSEVEDMSRSSSISSIGIDCMSDKVVKNGSAFELSSIRSKSPSKSDLALSAEYKEEDDEDGYHQSQDESEEEDGVPASLKFPGLKGGKVSTPKKLVRRRHPPSPSPPSSEAGSCTETESSCGSSDESCTLEPPASSRATSLPSSSPRMRRPRLGSARARERPPTPTEESEDTVTDVTPLSTPEISPLKSLDLTQGSVLEEAENGRLQEQTQPESAPSSGLSNTSQEDEGSKDVDKSSLGVESRLGSQLAFHCPGGRNRKNYSFTNDEVRCIDRENQRLLQELSRLSPMSRPGSTGGGKSNTANNPPPVRLYHSALNRQREQQRIERENLAFLKRLESIKPTAGMRRSEQLADYQRQARYLGTGSLPIYRSPAKKEKASSRTPSGKGSKPATAVHRSTRSASAAVDSTNTPMSMSNKASLPRPAWC